MTFDPHTQLAIILIGLAVIIQLGIWVSGLELPPNNRGDNHPGPTIFPPF